MHTIVLTPADAEAPNRTERESLGHAVGRHKCERSPEAGDLSRQVEMVAGLATTIICSFGG
jgi:hypothetical protein